MTEALNKTPHRVTSVAFGGEWDSYFIVTQNGGYMYRNIPSALHDLIERRQQKTDIECLSLGPDGEYYLKAKNGRAWWGGVSTSTLNTIAKHKDNLTFLDFGNDDTYLLRF